MDPHHFRIWLAAEVARTSARNVALRLGVSPRVIPTYLAGCTRFQTAAEIERRAAELGWPPSADEGES